MDSSLCPPLPSVTMAGDPFRPASSLLSSSSSALLPAPSAEFHRLRLRPPPLLVPLGFCIGIGIGIGIGITSEPVTPPPAASPSLASADVWLRRSLSGA